MGRKHSDIWNYFRDNKDGTGTCTVCKNKLSYKTSASNLRKHLRRKHPQVGVQTIKSAVELVDMENFDIISPVIDLNEKRNNKLDTLLEKVLYDSDSENGFINSKHSEKVDRHGILGHEGKYGSDEDYNPSSESTGSSTKSLTSNRRKGNYKDNTNDASSNYQLNHRTLSSEEESFTNINNTRKVIRSKSIKQERITPPRKTKYIKMRRASSASINSIQRLDDAVEINSRNACDAYAANLSLQLNQMEENQRFIAEKLISDIVFYGRFNKLSEEMQFTLPVKSPPTVVMIGESNDTSKDVSLKYNDRTVFPSNDNKMNESAVSNDHVNNTTIDVSSP